MSGNCGVAIYIGNLDERVSERVLYDILIQAGRVVELYMPRDKETDKPKGYAFAEYETQQIADYAIKLFSGVVTLYNRTLKFALSSNDKSSQNSSTSRKSRQEVETRPFSSQEPTPPGVNATNYNFSSGSRRYDASNSIPYPSY